MVVRRYGGPEVLHLEEVPTPAPREREVLVKMEAAGVGAGEWHLLRGDPFLVRLIYGGPFRPRLRVLGSDIAGRVEAVGAGVERFRVGDAVFGDLSGAGFGTFAEYARAPERALSLLPAGFSMEEAAALPVSGQAALQGLRDAGRLCAGQQVLVVGAAGGVGHLAVQIAKAMGAAVTGVCSARNADFVRGLGAEAVIDYAREDFTRAGARYDLILDAAASHSFWATRRALRPGGRYVLVGGASKRFFQMMVLGGPASAADSRKTVFLSSSSKLEDLLALKELAEAGKLRPAIEKRFPLAELPAAIRHVEAGHTRGKVVIVP